MELLSLALLSLLYGGERGGCPHNPEPQRRMRVLVVVEQ